jgi:hypothetical protein
MGTSFGPLQKKARVIRCLVVPRRETPWRRDRRRDTTQRDNRHNVQTINEKVRHFEFVVQAPATSRNSLPQAREERFQDRSPDVGGIAAFGKHMTFGPERWQQVIFDIPAGKAEFLGHALR